MVLWRRNVGQLGDVGESGPVAPLRVERGGGAHGRPFGLGDDAEEVLDAHDAHVGDAGDGRFVHREELRAHARRADHAAVQHAGQFEIVDEGLGARAFAGDIGARQRLADDAVRRGVLQRDLGVDLQAKGACRRSGRRARRRRRRLSAAPGRPPGSSSDAGRFSRSAPSATSCSRAVAAAWRTPTPPCVSPELPPVLPWSGVSSVSPSTRSTFSIGSPSSSAAIWRTAMRRPVPRSTLPVKIVAEPSGWMARKVSTSVPSTGLPANFAAAGGFAPRRGARGHREADDQAAAGAQDVASGKGAHAVLPVSREARSTARTILVCVPQRQRQPASPCFDLLGGRLRRAIEQRLRRHDHAVGAVSALGRLFGDEGGLQRGSAFRECRGLRAS